MTIGDLKRTQQADAIVEATLQALRKHGYAATSLQRVAEEAGTSKRMVLHYFASRQELFDTAVRRICRRILGQVEQAVADAGPAAALHDGLDRLWKEIVADPGLHAIFFGLIAESVTDPSLRPTISAVRDEYRDLIARLILTSQPPGAGTDPEQVASTATLVLATMVGLTIDYLERGDTPALRRALAEFQLRAGAVAPAT
jgi:AcrR family transcriptional regulator